MTSSASGAAALIVLRSRSRAGRNFGGTRAKYSSIVFGGGAASGFIFLGQMRCDLRTPRQVMGGTRIQGETHRVPGQGMPADSYADAWVRRSDSCHKRLRASGSDP